MYVDGFVLAVPTRNLQAYKDLAAKAWPIFRKYGAMRHVECWGDDVPDGKITDFRRAVQATGDETVVFSWVEYPSKAVRDAAYEKMHDDPEMAEMSKDMPCDGKRMIMGGFAPIFDEAAPA